jgi:hypothetical protein
VLCFENPFPNVTLNNPSSSVFSNVYAVCGKHSSLFFSNENVIFCFFYIDVLKDWIGFIFNLSGSYEEFRV